MSLSGITVLYHRKYKKKGATEVAPVIQGEGKHKILPSLL
jgi:hypothetical protein